MPVIISSCYSSIYYYNTYSERDLYLGTPKSLSRTSTKSTYYKCAYNIYFLPFGDFHLIYLNVICYENECKNKQSLLINKV